jgi:hypothetical protein
MATLNPLDKGECYGLTMGQMKQQLPVRVALSVGPTTYSQI